MRFLAILFLLAGCSAPGVFTEAPSVFTQAPRYMIEITPIVTEAATLQEVNNRVNRTPDCEDEPGKDFVKDPVLFMATCGDCEDHAAAKAAILFGQGYRLEDMVMVVYVDPLGVLNHVVLVVKHNRRELELNNTTDYIHPMGHLGPGYTIGFSPG